MKVAKGFRRKLAAWLLAIACVAIATTVYANGPKIIFILILRSHNSRWMCDFVREHGEEALPLMQGALREPDFRSRVMIASSLACYDGDLEAIEPLLRICLADPDRRVKSGALQTIASFGARSAIFLPDLIRMIDRDDPSAAEVASILYALGAPARTAIPSLKNLILRNPSLQEPVEESIRALSSARSD